MKKLITIVILLLPALFACKKSSESGSGVATSVVLSMDKVSLSVGETATLSAAVLPSSLKMGVVWSVLDDTYVDVDGGRITAKAEGVTYVIATSADGFQKAACMVSVNPPVQYSVTILDEIGQPVSNIFGYPGQNMILSAYASDGEVHELTWSIEDEGAATISDDGLLVLGAQASTSDDYIYDAQSFVKVVTEDGRGAKVPIRSSLLNGIRLDEDYYPAGTVIDIEESHTYSISFLYQAANETTGVIPAGGINLDLTNTTDFTIQDVGGVYMLVTGDLSEVSSTLSVSAIGLLDKVELVEFNVPKSYPIKAKYLGGSSSTLSFEWTEGGGASDDASKPYTATLYKDADCTEVEISYDIPAEDACWNSQKPKFVFSGLAPGTTYWFKVTDTSGEEIESAIIPATTEVFENVMVSSEPAAVGSVILAEDFSQLCWGADEINQAAGIDVANSSVGYNTDTKKSFTDRTAAMFVKTTGQYAQRSLTAQTVAKKESGVRFAKWAQGQYARIYIGPGYLFLSTSSYGTHIITPELNNIPEGQTATLKVKLHAAGRASGGAAALAVQHNKSFSEISSGTQTNKNKIDLSSNVKTIEFEGGLTNLQEFEVTIEGVVKGDRICFGPTSETASGSSNMMILSDMTITIVELQ